MRERREELRREEAGKRKKEGRRGERGGGRAGTSGTQHKALFYVALLDGDVAPGFMMY